jgi:hypothetical protein
MVAAAGRRLGAKPFKGMASRGQRLACWRPAPPDAARHRAGGHGADPGYPAVMRVVPVPCLQDNYAYLVVCEQTGRCAVVDPGEPGPVLAAVAS